MHMPFKSSYEIISKINHGGFAFGCFVHRDRATKLGRKKKAANAMAQHRLLY